MIIVLINSVMGGDMRASWSCVRDGREGETASLYDLVRGGGVGAEAG